MNDGAHVTAINQDTDSLQFRVARKSDLAAIVALLAEGSVRPTDAPSLAAAEDQFDRLTTSGVNHLIVGETNQVVVACYQMTLIHGLSLSAASRAHIEGVRVAAALRGRGFGAALMADVEARATASGAVLIQFMSHNSRAGAHRFYRRLGYEPSHTGFKKSLPTAE